MSEGLKIFKMSGAGNDFIVLGPEQARELRDGLAAWARRVCRRGLAVGADGVLVVEPVAKDRVRVVFHNPDGDVAFCGNGSRCAARFAVLQGMTGPVLTLETAAGEVAAEVLGRSVRLSLPPPRDLGPLEVEAAGCRLEGRRILAGAPHFVTWVRDVASAPVEVLGPAVRRDPRFEPTGTNVTFAARLDERGIAVRTWERGVEGETLACGSGAIAGAFASWREGRARPPMRVVPRSGIPLLVDFAGAVDTPRVATLEGDARVIFEGILHPEGTSGFPGP